MAKSRAEYIKETGSSPFNDVKDYYGAFNNAKPIADRTIEIWTGELGAWNIDFIIRYGKTLDCKMFIKIANMKGQYISLFSKRSNFKLYTIGDTFKFFKGTKLIKTFNDVTNECNTSKLDVANTNVSLKTQEVNDYINNVLTSLYEKENTSMEINTFENKLKILNERARYDVNILDD